MHTAIHHSPHLQEYPQKKMQYHSLVPIAYVLALLCPLLCVGYLRAVDPDVVIYRHVNATDSNTDSSSDTGSCIFEGVCDNGAALCAQGNEVVLGSECDPTGFWTALLLLKWVYIFVWLTRLPFLFTSVMRVAGKEGKVTLPRKLVDVFEMGSQLASLATFVITVGAYWERNQEGTYFPTGFPYMLWYVMRLDFGMSSALLPPSPGWRLILLVSLCLSFPGLAKEPSGDMPFYLPFAIMNCLGPVVWFALILSLSGLGELLTVCSFFVYTASYYALDVEDREDTTYFRYGNGDLLMMAPMCLFLIAVSVTLQNMTSVEQICKPITWEGVCAMPQEQAAAVTNVLGVIHAEIAARRQKHGKDFRDPEALPQDTLHTAFHGATTAEMSKIVSYFCETRNGFSIIVASRVLIDKNDLLVDMRISASLKYRLLKACDDEALSHVLQTIPIAELCKAINDVERNPEEALDYVEKFVCVEKLIPECKAVPSWRGMLPFVGSAHTPTCALLARGYKGLLPKRRLYIAAAVMWVCMYLAGLVFSIYVCATLGLEEDTDGSMPLFLVFLVPAGVLVSYDVVSPPIRHALYAHRTRRANNSPSEKMKVKVWSPDFLTLSEPLRTSFEKLQSADDGADGTIQLEEVDVEGAQHEVLL